MDFIGTGLASLAELQTLSGLFQNEFLVTLLVLGLTTALVALCVPGVIVPLSFSSGALLGGWEAVLAVSAGALIGSQLLFLVARHLMADRVRRRLGPRVDHFERHFSRRGIIYVAGLRVAGAPHFLVTAASALTSLRATYFAAASLAGFLPAIIFTATAGALV